MTPSPRAVNRSLEEEILILVNEQDEATGTASKLDCHLGAGRLHRAFSIFLFNDAGELLIQQRSPRKMLWGEYWANSCCSHPRAGEDVRDAAVRRLQEELGMQSELRFLYKFVYQAKFGDIGSEYENCWVFAGHAAGLPVIDPAEIADWRFIAPAELSRELAAHKIPFAPWFRLEWERIEREFLQGSS